MELAQNPRFAGGLRDGWEQRGWPVTRGGAARCARNAWRAEGGIRARIPARCAIRRSAGRSPPRRHRARRPDDQRGLETLKAVEFTDLVAASYTELKSKLAIDPVARSLDRASAADVSSPIYSASPSYEFGQWVGAADVAAQMHDASFLESRHGTRFIQSALPAGSLTAEDVEALRAIDARVSQSGGAKRPRARRRARDTSDSRFDVAAAEGRLFAGGEGGHIARTRLAKTPFPFSALIALVAVLAISVSGGLRHYLRSADAAESGSVGRLAKIVGPHRLTRARLTGGFAFAPCAIDSSAERLVRGLLCDDPAPTSWSSASRLRTFAARMRLGGQGRFVVGPSHDGYLGSHMGAGRRRRRGPPRGGSPRAVERARSERPGGRAQRVRATPRRSVGADRCVRRSRQRGPLDRRSRRRVSRTRCCSSSCISRPTRLPRGIGISRSMARRVGRPKRGSAWRRSSRETSNGSRSRSAADEP